jgi:hypothetical protein
MWHRNVMKECSFGPNDGILTSLKGEDFFIGTKAILLHHVLISHRVANIIFVPNGNIITAWSRLTTDICSETKNFLLLDGFNVSLNKYIIRVSK